MQVKPFESAKQQTKLFESLLEIASYEAKATLLEKQVLITPELKSCISRFKAELQYSILVTIVIGQGHVFRDWQQKDIRALKTLASTLYEVEMLYKPIGGIVGYQQAVNKQLQPQKKIASSLRVPKKVSKCPECTALGIKNLPFLGELFPVGGAADRLNLKNGTKSLPAAMLKLGGHSLLEHLLLSLEGREYLYYKLFGKRVSVPVSLMTSGEKSNHNIVIKMLEEAQWFGRCKNSFFLFKQPVVPCVDKNGMWVVDGPLSLRTKPGGHGVIWILADEKKVFPFFERHGVKHLIVRQINNPASGIDDELFCLAGEAIRQQKGFAFLTCPQKKGANEGMIAEKDGVLTNVEYALFKESGITNEEFGSYPANTNTLFASIDTIKEAIKKNPFPGQILNYSKKNGKQVSARLETMMQNISETIDKENILVYETERCKAIGAAKKSYKKGADIFETPLGALHTLLESGEHLLRHECQIETPGTVTPKVYEDKGPKYFLKYHPALGPQFSVIKQKIQGGTIGQGSALILGIAEILWRDVVLQGALSITCEQVTGHLEGGVRKYSSKVGQCVLHNVFFKGPAISARELKLCDLDEEKAFFSIHMEGNSQFSAVDVTFHERLDVVVPDGMHAHARMVDGEAVIEYTSIDNLPTLWNYNLNGDAVILT